MTAPTERRAAVGELVRDTARGCEAVLWAAIELVARRGTWGDQ
ncbi:hypothetical protein ACFV2N_18075 [Streptomyces sp. NPDC059680]